MTTIGTDDWVAQADALIAPAPRHVRLLRRIPLSVRFAAFLAAAACIPLVTGNEYVIRVGFDTLVYLLLAVGLNVVAGWAGLLDLGYFAFFGCGAYFYAMLASSHFGVHLPAEVTLPIVLVGTGALGLVLSLPARRLSGDYLAIVSLFVGQVFLILANNADRIDVPFVGRVDFTGGPNGLTDVDPIRLFGLQIESVQGYFWFALSIGAVVIAALHFANDSRVGRAWRSLREDELAAELMGMPTQRLKMLAFGVGAAVAGLTGAIFAALNTNVFPGDFGLPLLILIYAMVILGGIGTLTGVIAGAIVVNVLLEVLRTPDHARWVFYGGVALALLAKIRPWKRLAALVAGTVALGFAIHAVAAAVSTNWTSGGSGVRGWLLGPPDGSHFGTYAYVALILAVLAMLRLTGWRRDAVAVVALYLAVFEWETVLVEQPSVTRVVLLGALLVALIVARPQGLLGRPRVDTV
jgi:ABC-type branched-subunit amino acid transport system permease subunit